MRLVRDLNFLPGGLRLGHLLIALGGVGLLAVFAPTPAPEPRAGRTSVSPGAGSGAARSEAGGVLGGKRDAFSVQGVADLFSSASWLPPPPPVIAAKPVAPPFPYHYVGTLSDNNGERQVFLAQHGSGVIVTPKAGDVLAASFKVEAVGADNLSLLYIPLNEKRTISFSSMGPEPGTSQAPGASTPAPVMALPFVGAEAGRIAAGSASNVTTSLPPIAGIAVAPAVAAAATSPAPAAAGTISGVTGFGSSTSGIGTAPPAAGASPASPGAAPQAAPLGTVPLASAPLGSPATATGTLGTMPVNPDRSVLFGPKPTSGGPGMQ